MDSEKRAPVQGYAAGIPWSMHLRAYDAYCKEYGPQKALIEGHCRGGFSTSELDMFIPGWREELSELEQLKRQLAESQAEAAVMRDALEQYSRPDYYLFLLDLIGQQTDPTAKAKAALKTTTGRDLLAELKRLRAMK